MKIVTAFCAILWVVLLPGCEKKSTETDSPFLLFPAGRSFLGSSEVKLLVGDIAYQPDTVFDSCGGYWFKIAKADLPESGNISIQYTRKKGDVLLFKGIKDDSQNWLSASPFIDCDNEVLKTTAAALTKGCPTNEDKAKQIQQFVARHVKLQIYHNSFLDKASRTYDLGYGSCMNFSRLYIALCRAVGIPARSVWGVIYGYNDDNIYDYHHQWAEILDEDGYWHPADFSYTTKFDLSDVRYLDLIYAAEENSLIRHRVPGEIKAGEITYFDNYPVTLTGRLGFQLVEDHRPEYMTVRYTYRF